MKPESNSYEAHLVIEECRIVAGGEFIPKYSGWCLIQVCHGTGYWIHRESHQLEPGCILVLGPKLKSGVVRASVLGEMRLCILPINPARLAGLFSMVEQKNFAAAAAREDLSLKLFRPKDPYAIRLQEIFDDPKHSSVSYRLRALQLFIEGLGVDLRADTGHRDGIPSARKRLEDFLSRSPASDLVNFRITDVAKATGCGPRHLSRLFQDIFKVSFREKQTDLRLARARDLLANTDAKIVEVSLESGYQSVSLFSLMFSKRYGLSPGRWRQKYRETKKNSAGKIIRRAYRVPLPDFGPSNKNTGIPDASFVCVAAQSTAPLTARASQ